jgi:hypothetical protein
MCHSFPIKTSKRKAYITAFFYANLVPIINSLSILYIGGEIIEETETVLLISKALVFFEEFIMICFLSYILDIVWYRTYWLTIILHTVMSFPLALLYYAQFTTEDSQGHLMIHLLTLETLPKYIVILLIILLFGGILLLLSRFIKRFKKLHQISKLSWFILYSGWFLIMLSSTKNYQSKNDHTEGGLEGLNNVNQVLIGIAVLLIIMLIAINHSDKRLLRVENALLKEQNEIQYANYLALQQQELNIHKLYHDIGNHIKTIQVLVNNGDNKEAREYTENLVNHYREINKVYYCNNKIINAVLSQKLKVCDQSNITYDIDLTIPEGLTIRDIDLMSVYSNLLDNAIESCQRNENTNNYIKVKSSLVGNYFAIKIVNSKYQEKNVINEKGRFTTWKKNKTMHGYGIRILEEIIERYDGQKELIDLGEEFSAMVMLKAQ